MVTFLSGKASFTRSMAGDGLRPSLRVALGRVLGRAAADLSRRTGRGSGGVIDGRVLLALAPSAAQELSCGREIVLVSGTNGKTTTTAFLAAMLRSTGPVVSNEDGANTPAGLVHALAQRPAPQRVVLETDEAWVPWTLQETGAATTVLLNLSRDQLHRHHEVAALSATWAAALEDVNHAVANADDPAVVHAATSAARQTWVAAGAAWTGDLVTCPRCGREFHLEGVQWWCTCGLRRPEPDWWLEADYLVSRGARVPLEVALPGRASRANAAMAIASAVDLGVPPEEAAAALQGIRSVGGRFQVFEHEGRHVRLLLAKNPAGWVEALDVVGPSQCPLVLAFNSAGVDGRDPSWLYDVPFGKVADRPLVVTGSRATDMEVRLEMEELGDVLRAPSVIAALDLLPAGDVYVVANYTAFQDARKELDSVS